MKNTHGDRTAHTERGDGDKHGAAQGLRLDIWLWSVRIYKTRALAAEAASKGRITVNGTDAKPARLVRVGDRIEVRHAGMPLAQELTVLQVPRRRGSATVAATSVSESERSKAARSAHETRLRMAPEPALQIKGGRPTKRDRRELTAVATQAQGERWQRWSAALTDVPSPPAKKNTSRDP